MDEREKTLKSREEKKNTRLATGRHLVKKQRALQSSKKLQILTNSVYNQKLESVIKCFHIILIRNSFKIRQNKTKITR